MSESRPIFDPLDWLDDALAALDRSGLQRRLRTVETFQGAALRVDGREVVSFASNDYLGLAGHGALRRAAGQAAEALGTGSRASPLIVGHSALQARLEGRLAVLKGKPRALVFPSGYAANLGTITALADKGDLVMCDRLNHASIVDGISLSGGFLRTYGHADPDSLARRLQKYRARFRRCYVVTESLFSMDGDVAPLEELAELCARWDACLMVDEAHATGVLGAQGRGGLEASGVDPARVHVVMGTLSKALGSQGGFVAADERVIDWLVNKARPYIYSTALSPVSCAAALAALEVLEAQPERVTRLRGLSRRLNGKLAEVVDGFEAAEPATPIIPVVVGEAGAALALQDRLLEEGFLVPAIRPPSVRRGQARLRISLSAAHTPDQVDAVAAATGKHLRKMGGERR